jgi:hypothetical protein
VPFSYQRIDLAGQMPAPGVSRRGSTAVRPPQPRFAPCGLALAGQGLTRPPVRAGGVAWDRCPRSPRKLAGTVPAGGWDRGQSGGRAGGCDRGRDGGGGCAHRTHARARCYRSRTGGYAACRVWGVVGQVLRRRNIKPHQWLACGTVSHVSHVVPQPVGGMIPPAMLRESRDPVQARCLDRDPEVSDDRHTVREASLAYVADIARESGTLGRWQHLRHLDVATVKCRARRSTC